MDNLILFYISTTSQIAAQDLISHLMQERVIASAHLVGNVDLAWWEHQNQHDITMVAKTTPELMNQAISEIEKHAISSLSVLSLSAQPKHVEHLRKMLC